jgi:hypothetical protein
MKLRFFSNRATPCQLVEGGQWKNAHAERVFLAVLVVCLLVGGCKAIEFIAPLGDAAAANSTAPPINSNSKLMIFGGTNHGTYLGCLNCSEYATDSVLNKYGSSGSPYSAESIFNHYGQFGSRYSTESACNQYATDPPVIVDGDGKYYGRLTLNRYATGIGIGTEYMGWLAAVCQ